jgi:trehalose synthase
LIESELPTLEPSLFEGILSPRRWRQFDATLRRSAALMEGRTLFHVNSTATGGGVAELLSSVLGYLLGANIQSRWLVVEGTEDFFVLTKRIHHLLHGKEGDAGDLGPAEAQLYTSALTAELPSISAHVKPGDVVILHDPQVVGLAPHLREMGASVIWNCHVGADVANGECRRAWEFLLPATSSAHAQVFSREQYVWEGLNREKVVVIPPCIDAFSPKNQALDPDQARRILAASGLFVTPGGPEGREGPGGPEGLDGRSDEKATFTRIDGSVGKVRHAVRVLGTSALPPEAPLVTQISRWDPLKDHAGVAKFFAEAVPPEVGAHLVLAGPSPDAVADDPESVATFDELGTCIASLPEEARSRVHVACLPMDDIEENAAIVNALQRCSDVVVQKSLAEGFGLTVAEAMWKGRPTVATSIGGIQDQISHGLTGVLIDDPEDSRAFGKAVTDLLCDRDLSNDLGRAAHRSVVDNFLAPRYLGQYLELVETVLTA